MFDQSFSVKNFRKIYDLDRKKKGNIEKEHFPQAHEIRLKLYGLNKISRLLFIRHKQKKVTTSWFERKRERLNEHIKIRKEQLNTEVNARLQEIVQLVSVKGYTLPLEESPDTIRDKVVYSIGKSVETIFVSRQIQYTLSSLYKVKVNNRDIIISRLSQLVKDFSPKYLIRADVENFYESINHKILLDILHSSPKLSVTPRRVLTQLIRSYACLTNGKVGLPRGVGISAYLSEVYMENIDLEISALPDVTFYERYVDDIIVIFSPEKAENTTKYLPRIREIILERKLNLNDKTKEFDLFQRQSSRFDYLGYLFQVSNGDCKIKMSNKKKEKIKKRVNESFDTYLKERVREPKKSKKSLLSRIRFLTGNTRLYNSKSKAFVGIYFSNKFITDTSDLRGLDHYLRRKVILLNDEKLENRIKKLSFNEGFEGKIFRKFSIFDLSKISKAWKND